MGQDLERVRGRWQEAGKTTDFLIAQALRQRFRIGAILAGGKCGSQANRRACGPPWLAQSVLEHVGGPCASRIFGEIP